MASYARGMSAPVTDRSRVRRHTERARYDRETIASILRAGLVAHVGIVDGGPVVIPMAYGVDDDWLYLHGSPGSRLMRMLGRGAEVCVTVTLLDGLVLARSVAHHSMNYRSVALRGRAEGVVGDDAKLAALETTSEHLVPGQWGVARLPSERELTGVAVVRVPLDEASAKVRTGPPIDEEEDHALPVWAGTLAVEPRYGPVEDAPDLPAGLAPPAWITGYRRPGS